MAASKLPQRFAPTDLTDANIAAGAAIATSKLADSANFILRGGSVAFTGNQPMGNNKITGLQTATNTDEATNLGQVQTLIGNLNTLYKYRNVRAKSTATVTISNPGTAIFDGVTLTTGDRILLNNQTAPAENGIYVFATSSTAMTRAADADAWTEFPGSLVSVNEGTVAADTKWFNTSNDGGTLGTTALTYTADTSTGLTSANFVDQETPSGTPNGATTSFTLANTPTSGSVHLWLEGWLLYPGSGNDYTISGATITMLTAPLTGERLRASYRK